jgi:D-glycerate 3-kinase
MPDRPDARLGWDAADRMVADAIVRCRSERARPILVGLSGAQGSGKSTLAARLPPLLADRGLRTAVLALDDFYLTRRARQALARSVHPLFATRGVPGTHDIALLDQTITAMLQGQSATVPRFDKATDDRRGTEWIDGQWDVLLLEGWCIGARPQSAQELDRPVNRLEREEDAAGTWRRWVNHRLASDYADLFARLDLTIFLRAPCFDVVHRWRAQQEDDLETLTGSRGMTGAELLRFVAHYERITRWMNAEPPGDLAIEVDAYRTPRL